MSVVLERAEGVDQPLGHHAMSPIIEVHDLVKRYKGADRNAVDGVSFTVQPGEFFTLLGPNGAGKTTTISILTTTLSPTAGRLRIAGFDATTQASKVRQNVGIIFQKPSLDLNLSAEENVRFHAVMYGLYPFRPAYALMPRSYKKQVSELADVLGIQGEMFKPVKTFSGGMKRKLEIIRSLIHRPRVLFLDEPTTGLDPESRRNLWQYLRQVRDQSGTTTFLTTHYLEEAENADTICIINKGKVVSYGSPDQVKSHLVEEYLLVETAPADRAQLCIELAALGLANEETPRGLKILLNGRRVHEVLRSIETPLTEVRTHTPTIEDAYLEILASTGGPKDGEEEGAA